VVECRAHQPCVLWIERRVLEEGSDCHLRLCLRVLTGNDSRRERSCGISKSRVRRIVGVEEPARRNRLGGTAFQRALVPQGTRASSICAVPRVHEPSRMLANIDSARIEPEMAGRAAEPRDTEETSRPVRVAPIASGRSHQQPSRRAPTAACCHRRP
jgi:hypothetical protein